jgi:hypothetical protein
LEQLFQGVRVKVAGGHKIGLSRSGSGEGEGGEQQRQCRFPEVSDSTDFFYFGFAYGFH